MTKLRVLDLFTGAGMFSLGLERTGGFETTAFCEIAEFPRKVLAKHWPDVPCFPDVTKLTIGDVGSVDIITGGFPCQDISLAGKQKGMGRGTRSGLWGECIRLVSELRPKYAIFENVTNLLAGPSEQSGGWFSRILIDLAQVGYDAEWHCIPSCYVGGCSKRDRVWIIAYPNDEYMQGRGQKPIFRQSDLSREPARMVARWPGRSNLPTPRFSRTSNAVPSRMDRTTLIGNSLDPKIPEMIGHAILEAEGQR